MAMIITDDTDLAELEHAVSLTYNGLPGEALEKFGISLATREVMDGDGGLLNIIAYAIQLRERLDERYRDGFSDGFNDGFNSGYESASAD